MGERGLVRTGALNKVSPKHYELTAQGRAAIQNLLGSKPDPEALAKKCDLDRETEAFLLQIFETAAYRNMHSPSLPDFQAACEFWGCAPEKITDDIHNALQRTSALLQAIRTAIGDGGTTLKNGRYVPGEEVKALVKLHDSLSQRFQTLINLLRLRNRTSTS